MKAEIFRQGLHVFKQNLKFSSAHFLIFDSKQAEKLHGHNYQVILNVYRSPQPHGGSFPAAETGQLGYWVDFGELKKRLKELVDLWDEKVLLPRLHPEMRCEEWDATTYKVTFRDRVYAFPKNEVEWLPVVNTSVECLSELLLKELVGFFEPCLL
ncbi:MAG: 6-carboxytetrahydropterin synthase, partial [Bdellovibrionaceae bacterium]|nr:6-carboxytetrahydropterin synthase [Pseudobdellovibrionaceae bacterium]